MPIRADDSCLLVVDIQDRLLPKMAHPERVVANTAVLLQAAGRLGVPVLASEQYPRGLGPTVADVAQRLPAGAVVEKLAFSCLGEPGFAERFRALGRSQAVVCGMEAHVCVMQTVDDLAAAGTRTFVVADAASSRDAANHELAMARMAQAGAVVVSTEMVVFEWLARAGTDAFRELSALIK